MSEMLPELSKKTMLFDKATAWMSLAIDTHGCSDPYEVLFASVFRYAMSEAVRLVVVPTPWNPQLTYAGPMCVTAFNVSLARVRVDGCAIGSVPWTGTLASSVVHSATAAATAVAVVSWRARMVASEL